MLDSGAEGPVRQTVQGFRFTGAGFTALGPARPATPVRQAVNAAP